MDRPAGSLLVVDDDPTQRRLIQAVLEREGFAVVHAESGDDAIKRLSSGVTADVVLLDQRHLPAALGENARGGGAHRPGSDDDGLAHGVTPESAATASSRSAWTVSAT